MAMGKNKFKLRNVYILLDTSGSMKEPTSSGEALIDLARSLLDDLAFEISRSNTERQSIAVTLLGFNEQVTTYWDHATLSSRTKTPAITPMGRTYFGAAIDHLAEVCKGDFAVAEKRGEELRKPIAFLITDGRPQGESTAAREQAWEKLVNLGKPIRPAFFTFPIPPFDGNEVRFMHIDEGKFFHNLTQQPPEDALELIMRIIKTVTLTTIRSETGGSGIENKSPEEWSMDYAKRATDHLNSVLDRQKKIMREGGVNYES
jgi:hypothetical protein